VGFARPEKPPKVWFVRRLRFYKRVASARCAVCGERTYLELTDGWLQTCEHFRGLRDEHDRPVRMEEIRDGSYAHPGARVHEDEVLGGRMHVRDDGRPRGGELQLSGILRDVLLSLRAEVLRWAAQHGTGGERTMSDNEKKRR